MKIERVRGEPTVFVPLAQASSDTVRPSSCVTGPGADHRSVVWFLRRPGTAARGAWALRRDVIRRRPTKSRDWHSHGARCHSDDRRELILDRVEALVGIGITIGVLTCLWRGGPHGSIRPRCFGKANGEQPSNGSVSDPSDRSRLEVAPRERLCPCSRRSGGSRWNGVTIARRCPKRSTKP